MKQTRKLWVAAAAVIAAVLMVGCGSALTGVTVDSTAGGNGRKMVTLTGTITNYDEMIGDRPSAENSARTILPGGGTYSGWKYYLYGTSITGMKFGVTELKELSLDFTSSTSTTFTQVVEPSIWEFILFASDTALTAPTSPAVITETWILENAKLVAYASTDLENDGHADFTLSPDGVKGAGEINFKIYSASSWKDPSNHADGYNGDWRINAGDVVTAEIRNLYTGEVLKWNGNPSASPAIAPKETTKTISNTAASGTDLWYDDCNVATFGGPVADGYTLDPGTYNFVVTITRNKGEPNEKSFVWSDIIVVIAGRKIEQDVFVPNIIGLPPDNVSNFYAVYIPNTDDLPGHEGYYQMALRWTNNINNETHYKIELLDTTGLTAIPKIKGFDMDHLYDPDNAVNIETTDADEWTDAKTYNFKFWQEDIRVEETGGSLLANNEEIRIWVELGKPYFARIKAVNNVGESPTWTPVEVLSGGTDKTIALKDSTVPAYFNNNGGVAAASATKATFMSRFRITHSLNGGYYGKDATLTYNDKIEYHIFLNPATPVPVPLWDGYTYSEIAAGPAEGDNYYNKLPNGSYEKETSTVTGNLSAGQFFKRDEDAGLKRSESPLKFWVLDTTKYDTADGDLTKVEGKTAKTVVYSRDDAVHYYANTSLNSTSPALKNKEFTANGYEGWDNITVYAEYAFMDATVKIVDPVDYVLPVNWITCKVTTADGPTIAESFTVNRTTYKSVHSFTELSISLKMTVPENTIPAKYDTVKMVVKDSNGSIKKYSEEEMKGFGTANVIEFDEFDITNWYSGNYMVYFTATRKAGGKTITRELPILMIIED